MVRSTFFPFNFGSFLFSILHQISAVTMLSTIPTAPKMIPSVKASHSGRSAMHIPRAKSTPLTVPNINATKLLFFILNLPSLNQHLFFYCIYSIIFFKRKTINNYATSVGIKENAIIKLVTNVGIMENCYERKK